MERDGHATVGDDLAPRPGCNRDATWPHAQVATAMQHELHMHAARVQLTACGARE